MVTPLARNPCISAENHEICWRAFCFFPIALHQNWEPITKGKLAAFAAGVGLFLFFVFVCEPGFIFLLDHANLLFHEAGHPIIGLLSQRLETYGGTIGQLVFPVVLAISFWKKENALGFAASWIWFFENWFNIARYMADARALELPLLGGGDHDWNTILTRWNLLQYDTRIAAVLKIAAWVGLALACAWVGWRAWRDARRPATQREWVCALPE